MMRPGKRERITLPAVRDRLTAGLTAGDVSLASSKRIFSFTAGSYVVSDMFSHVVDYDEVASFGTSTFFAYDNIVNGFVSADGWPLIINFPRHEDNSPYPVPITLQKPQTLSSFTWIGNVFYWPQTKVNLVFDGDRANMLSFDTQPNAEPQTFAIEPPRPAREVTLEIAGWTAVPDKVANIGIDNIYLKAQRPPEFHQRVHPMLNIGGLMHYTDGPGNIVLCNLLFKDQEELPKNVVKKRTILATILRNLHAPFAGGRTVLAGMNLTYEPVTIATFCTQYRDEKGWFGDKKFTFRDLPTGEQRLASARFNIYEMATSPVPNVLMLAGRGVPGTLPAEIRGIAVGRKADAIFFLQTARIDKRRRPDKKGPGIPLELARYAIHYADGQQAELPILAEVDVEDYHQKSPAVIPGAQLAWIKPYEGTEYSAVAYSKQWSNPRPDVAIASIDILPGKDACGVPAVLAITTARVE
jgi:beta-galactosidase